MNPKKTIRVLLVEDSAVALVMLKRMLDVPGIEVVGEARDGLKGLELVEKLRPDVICTDLHMPRMNGLQMTHEVMNRWPTPILVVSCSVQDDDPHNTFELMEAGAVDVLPKPRDGLLRFEKIKAELVSKVRVLSGVHPIKRSHPSHIMGAAELRAVDAKKGRKVRIIAVGASTGGPVALESIFSILPRDFPVPIVCVQHISMGFLVDLASWLSTRCKLRVKVAENGEVPVPGSIYFAPDTANMEFNNDGAIRIVPLPDGDTNPLSIDVTFSSVARHYGKNAVGVLLTGMGSDGASGLQLIANAGGITMAQNEESCVVYGMPKVAIETGAAKHVLPLDSFAVALIEVANGGPCPGAGP